jgi:glucose/mannose transport system substrate-binding protein
MLKGFKRAGIAAAAAAVLTLAACGGSGQTGSSSAPSGSADGGAPSGSLEVFSWWTSGSEAAALDVLSKALTTGAPGVTFKNAAVSGGGGSNARTVLATRLQSGNPPDSWQLHPDKDLASVVEDGSVADLTDLYKENGWEDKLPEALKPMLQVDGKYYAVPVTAGRANMLWTSPTVLKKANVTWTEQTTITEFLADLPKIKQAGFAPICLGAKDPFATAQLLEAIIISNVGPDGWKQLNAGTLAFDDAKVRTAIDQFKSVLGNVNNDSAVLTWDQAALDTASGKCGATLMGDWAYGEMTNKGKKDGTDFSHVPFPGTSEVYDFVGDAFVIPADNAPNPAAAKVWLTEMLKPQVQADFNLAKGQAPVTKDAPTDKFPAYQKETTEAFQTKTIVSSLAHAESAPAEFASTYSDAVVSFLGSKNVDSFVKTMTEAQKNQLGG